MAKLKIDVPFTFYGGPFDKQTATLTYIPNLVFVHDGFELHIAAYTKVEEVTYLYSSLSSLVFPKTEKGRAAFLEAYLELPDYGLVWKKT